MATYEIIRYYSGYIADYIEAETEEEALKKAKRLPIHADELQDLEETDIEVSETD